MKAPLPVRVLKIGGRVKGEGWYGLWSVSVMTAEGGEILQTKCSIHTGPRDCNRPTESWISASWNRTSFSEATEKQCVQAAWRKKKGRKYSAWRY